MDIKLPQIMILLFEQYLYLENTILIELSLSINTKLLPINSRHYANILY